MINMANTECKYTLIVKNKILEHAGYSTPGVHYRVGDTMTVDENTFIRLQLGDIIERFTREGIIKFSKNDFEENVKYTQITIKHGTRKLR